MTDAQDIELPRVAIFDRIPHQNNKKMAKKNALPATYKTIAMRSLHTLS